MGKGIKITIMALIILSICFVLFSQERPKVLLIVREGSSVDKELMLTQEVGVMLTILSEAGFQVVVGTESGSPLTSETVNLKPDLTLDEVNIDEYEGVIMPCMGISFRDPAPPKSIELVKQAVANGLPIAAQVSSLSILAEAKILLGKKFASPYDFAAQGDTRYDGAQYIGRGVVQDGNIITSGTCPFMAKTRGLPDGTPELTKLLIQLISKK
ncbi:MAG: DJ-1/PfpI family protein [Candidatus Hodarchaeota archaeon]